MAVAVDSFELLFENLSQEFYAYKSWAIDILAIVGAFYITKVTLKYGSGILYKVWLFYKHTKNRNFVKQYGRWAIITGCTSGIGESFAKELARRGMNICLISRNEDKLLKQSRFLQRRYGAKTITHCHDFTNTSDEAYDEIKNKIKNIEIGILINNVGIHYDYPMYLTEVPSSVLSSMCHINMTSSVLMTKMVASLMAKQQRGLIVNMSSAASWSVNPMITVYGASKVFMSYFSKAMNIELKKDNIHVQCIEPMYIATNMTAYSKVLQTSRILTPSADVFVRNAVRTFGNVNSTTGFYSHSIQRLIIEWTPSWLYNSFSMRLHGHLNREGSRAQLAEQKTK